MKNKDFLSTAELAKILGISRVAVFKKIQNGEIKADKVGRSYVISRKELGVILGSVLSPEKKKEIEKIVNKAVKEYGETFKLLGKE
jgi:excisionase family DNA binding protein